VQLTVLGSGSGGNATLLAHCGRGVLIDAGLSYRQIVRRMSEIGFDPAGIEAIVITHAHGDHTRGVRMFGRRHDVPVYATERVRADWGAADVLTWRLLRANESNDVCGLSFYPVVIPHDASETVAFRIETGEGAIGFATDIGTMTSDLVDLFHDCRLLVVESNYATELLRVSPYNRSTRARIGGASGHLSNEALAAFVRQHLGQQVRCLILAHLSRVNNVGEIAEMMCREALAASGRDDVDVVVAQQDARARTVDLATWSGGSGVDCVQIGFSFDGTATERLAVFDPRSTAMGAAIGDSQSTIS
jgi:phosphoribosyl 1,2-cyclic phosphodiesterase